MIFQRGVDDGDVIGWEIFLLLPGLRLEISQFDSSLVRFAPTRIDMSQASAVNQRIGANFNGSLGGGFRFLVASFCRCA